MTSRPKVLVVSQAGLYGESNTSVTLRSLLATWPADRIRQIYADEKRPDGPDASSDWNLTLSSVPVHHLVYRRWLRHRIEKVAGSPGTPSGVAEASRGRAAGAVAVVRAWADLLPFTISRSLVQWLENFEPDVIVSPPGGSIRWMRLVEELSSRTRASLIPVFFDDWPTQFYSHSHWMSLPRRAMARRLQRIIGRSTVLVCISDRMARDYEQRYGVPAATFMRCVSIAEPRRSLAQSCGPLRLVYAGGLHLRRWEVLQLVGEAIIQLNTEGIETEMAIFAPPNDVAEWQPRLQRGSFVRVAGSLSPSDVADKLAEADVLVHVESFDEAIADYTRLSLSTKLPEYFASGRPLLVVGPPQIASVEYVQESGAGLVVSESGVAPIVKALRRLATEPGLRDALGQAGVRTASRRHDGAAERKRFADLLTAASVGRGKVAQ